MTSLRGHWLGGRILGMAEEEARARVECLPPGTSRIFLAKEL